MLDYQGSFTLIILFELSLFGQGLGEVRLQIMYVIGHAKVWNWLCEEMKGVIKYLFARTKSPSMYLVQT